MDGKNWIKITVMSVACNLGMAAVVDGVDGRVDYSCLVGVIVGIADEYCFRDTRVRVFLSRT